MKLFLISILTLFSLSAFAQIQPLPVDENTLALWNFDTDTGSEVIDDVTLVIGAMHGEAYNTILESVPEIDAGFCNGRRFVGEGSLVDLGDVYNSKLDFTNATELTVEAVIRLTDNANGNRVIFTSNQIQLMVIDNRLAGFVRENQQLVGLVSDSEIELNTNYQVALVKTGNLLGIIVNGVSHGSIEVNELIAPPSFLEANVMIGASIYAGEWFPGYIDDVRVSNIARYDITPPVINKLLPQGLGVTESFPEFQLELVDAGGVDVSSVEVIFNGKVQTGLTVTDALISGQLDDPMEHEIVNILTVRVADNAGNTLEKIYNFAFSSIGGKTEYVSDDDTLLLWHLNEFYPGSAIDSSNSQLHGKGNAAYLSSVEGIFSKGRHFHDNSSSYLTAGTVRIPDRQFTFELWVAPVGSSNYEEVLIDTGEIRVVRFDQGRVRVVFYETRRNRTFETIARILPTGEKHHFALSWDGTKESSNLKFIIDAAVVQIEDAPFNCDFDYEVTGVKVGYRFHGMLDEIRLSKIVRYSFNIADLESDVIQFMTLTNGSSVNVQHPELIVDLNSLASVDPANISVTLNGIEQNGSAGLSISDTRIQGTMDTSLVAGINYVKVEIIDNNGNQKVKENYFYFIENLGGTQYVVDGNTLALWTFDGAYLGQDSSGNGNDLNVSNAVAGKIGTGLNGSWSTSSDIYLNNRAFTLEAFVRLRDLSYAGSIELFEISASYLNIDMSLNPSTKNLQLYFYNSDNTINTTYVDLYPTDDQYHHVAIVFDGCAQSGQISFLVDGKVIAAFDAIETCKLYEKITISSNSSSYYLDIDEIRFSNVARNSFNIGTTNNLAPSVDIISPLDQTTINGAETAFEFLVSDEDGISSDGTYLELNGETVTTAVSQSGFNATLTGNITNLIGGANFIKIHAVDALGNENIKSMWLYRFDRGPSEPYTADSNTLLLLHLDEADGITLNDSSSSANNVVLGGTFNHNVDGMWGTMGVQLDSREASNNVLAQDLESYTIESWMKKNSTYRVYMLLVEGTYSLLSYSDYVQTCINGTCYEAYPTFDDQYHHYAQVVDASHPYKQLYLLQDGVVVNSWQKDPELLKLTAGNRIQIGETSDNLIDEVRLSNIARYEFNL